VVEDFLTLYNDPGEDYGWCVGCGTTLVSAGTTKMWAMADDVWFSLNEGMSSSPLLAEPNVRGGIDRADFEHMKIGRIVYEDFRIYPWAAKQLAWDRVRTARVIGALTFMARLFDIPCLPQPAAIKAAAVAAGAEELYYRPLHENRHQNDAIQHFVFYTNTELLGLYLPVNAVNPDEIEHHPV
jgi:hypothetical protein